MIHGWRGKAIDRARAAYAGDVSGQGAIAIACDTAPYMKAEVPSATRVPLLMTSDLLFANAAPLEAAVLAFAAGGGYAQIRRDAAVAYAGVQQSTLAHVLGAFTNPSDRRW